MILPLGLSGFAFSTTVFFWRYQFLFLGVSLALLFLAHYLTWRARAIVPQRQKNLLWVSTLLAVVSIAYVMASRGYLRLLGPVFK